jgi:hypothetical protein
MINIKVYVINVGERATWINNSCKVLVMKYKLYVDFDGVIWDTWPFLYKVLEDNNAELYNKVMSKSTTIEDDINIGKIFNNHIKWDEMIHNSSPIGNSLEMLNELNNTNMFDIVVLTHCNSDEEKECKNKIVKENLPGIDIMCVSKTMPKNEAVDPKGAILVDDFSGNLKLWQDAGGIAIKFTTKAASNSEFYHINSLIQIIDIVEEIESSTNQEPLELAEVNG